MSRKFVIFFLIISFLLISSSCGQSRKTVNEKVNQATARLSRDLAISQAREVYKLKKEEGIDMTNGPCLSNHLIDDWVFDIAHNPRQEIDNQPENQCSAYREGKAHHFVEFDPEGNLIRAQ